MATTNGFKEELDPAQVFEKRMLARHKPMNAATEPGDSEVQQFYKGTTLFLTGGSGFIGKHLIEKLFRATEVSKIFILLRSKKGKPIEERLKEMLEDSVYDLVREQKPGFEKKLVALEGDVGELRLGMREEDWKMVTEQVNIIFHAAATTRFDEVLRVATLINVRGTREILELGKQCKNLKSFVHISTAYCYAKEDMISCDILEKFYPSPIDPKALIRMAETMDDSTLNAITPQFIKGWANTYSYAKAVAEELVRTDTGTLPICVVRPAIVIAAFREPSPGWLDMSCVYGASGLILAPGIGIMHVLCANDEARVGIIPIDFVNNATIVAAKETTRSREEGDLDIKIYNMTTTKRANAVWGEYRRVYSKHYPETASPALVWYNFWVQTKSPIVFWILTWLFHMIPAYAIDGVCFLIGKERRYVKLYTKILRMSMALSYFTVNQWNFDDKNFENLYKSLSPIDKEIFYFDIDNLDFEEYLITWGIGIRKFLIKDGLKGSNYALKKRFFFKILHYIVTPIYFYILYKILCLGVGIISFVLSIFW